VFCLLTHRWPSGDAKASQKMEKDVKDFSLKCKKNLPFLLFQLPSEDPFLNCEWHKKCQDCDINHGANQNPLP